MSYLPEQLVPCGPPREGDGALPVRHFSHETAFAMIALTVATAGILTCIPQFYTLPGTILGGPQPRWASPSRTPWEASPGSSVLRRSLRERGVDRVAPGKTMIPCKRCWEPKSTSARSLRQSK
jgi:hypothetical protein